MNAYLNELSDDKIKSFIRSFCGIKLLNFKYILGFTYCLLLHHSMHSNVLCTSEVLNLAFT